MSEKTRIVVDRCPPVMNRIPLARRCRGLWTCLLIAMAMIAVPAARAAATFPMYVSSGSQSIVRVSSGGAVSPFATLPPNSQPVGLAFDGNGNIFAADFNTDQISKITPGSAVSLFATLPAGSCPDGLAFDGSGNLYAADGGTDQISRITSGGVVSLFATLPAGSFPNGLAFDSSGNLYAAEGNGQISKITHLGAVSLFATTLAGSGSPNGLAIDASGNLFVASGAVHISKITSGGVVSLFATLPADSFPNGLAFDASGNFYAADINTGQISQISPDGLTVTPFATGISAPAFIAFAPVPEPSSAVLLAIGSLALLRRRARRNNVEAAK